LQISEWHTSIAARTTRFYLHFSIFTHLLFIATITGRILQERRIRQAITYRVTFHLTSLAVLPLILLARTELLLLLTSLLVLPLILLARTELLLLLLTSNEVLLFILRSTDLLLLLMTSNEDLLLQNILIPIVTLVFLIILVDLNDNFYEFLGDIDLLLLIALSWEVLTSVDLLCTLERPDEDFKEFNSPVILVVIDQRKAAC
jgi:hypothetical protein